jgi:hypothetical protein
MITTIQASGAFPVSIYALGGEFMRASKLHECGAAISLIEELRQLGETCDVSKVAKVLFAGRLKVARRILQPLIDAGLVVVDASGCLSVCDSDEVRQASLALSELRFEPPERGYKLVLMPESIPPSAACLLSAFRVVENLPRGFLSDHFSQVLVPSPVHEHVACVSCQKQGPFIMKTDTDSTFVIYKHARSGVLKISYHFTQEQVDGVFQPGKLVIGLEGDDIKEKSWGWLTGSLEKMAGRRGKWEVRVTTPADAALFSSLLKISGYALTDVPGYMRAIESKGPFDSHRSIFYRPSGLSVKCHGLSEMPEDPSSAVDLALRRLAKDAEDGVVVICQPEAHVAELCRRFGFETGPAEGEVSEAMLAASANMGGAARARFFAANDWGISA